jgi:hypothetical protein
LTVKVGVIARRASARRCFLCGQLTDALMLAEVRLRSFELRRDSLRRSFPLKRMCSPGWLAEARLRPSGYDAAAFACFATTGTRWLAEP